jgi:hypothetical protein
MLKSEKKFRKNCRKTDFFKLISDGIRNYFCPSSYTFRTNGFFWQCILPVVILEKGRGPELFIPESLHGVACREPVVHSSVHQSYKLYLITSLVCSFLKYRLLTRISSFFICVATMTRNGPWGLNYEVWRFFFWEHKTWSVRKWMEY